MTQKYSTTKHRLFVRCLDSEGASKTNPPKTEKDLQNLSEQQHENEQPENPTGSSQNGHNQQQQQQKQQQSIKNNPQQQQPLGSLFKGKINPQQFQQQRQQQQQKQQQQKGSKPSGPRYAVMLESLNKKIASEYQDSAQVEIKGIKKEFQRLILKIKDLDSQREKAEETSSTVKDQLLRLTSDFENLRKRSEADKKDATTRAKSSLVEDLLPLIDNFELASNQIKTNTEQEEKINNSYQGMYKQMVDIFRSFGVSAVETVGSQFDPNVHEAVMREANDEVEDGTVIEEFRKGFIINGKLIRPAMVKVSYREQSQSMSSTDNASDTDSETETIQQVEEKQEISEQTTNNEDQKQIQSTSENLTEEREEKQQNSEIINEKIPTEETAEQTTIKSEQKIN